MAISRKSQARQLDPLEALANGDPLKVIGLMLWVNRLKNPDLCVRIEEKDIKALNDCCAFHKITPTVVIQRPKGTPAQPAVPASPGRRAISARAATPPKPFVTVTLVDSRSFTDPNSGEVHYNAIRPIENNETDFESAQAASEVKRAKEKAVDLAQRLMAQARSGDTSASDMMDAAQVLVTLGQAE